MIIGMQKRKLENYKEIIKTLLNKKSLSGKQKELLEKEKIINKESD